jgi:hypothetical protein
MSLNNCCLHFSSCSTLDIGSSSSDEWTNTTLRGITEYQLHERIKNVGEFSQQSKITITRWQGTGEMPEKLLPFLLNNTNLVYFKDNAGMFNAAQMAQIKQVIQKNNKKLNAVANPRPFSLWLMTGAVIVGGVLLLEFTTNFAPIRLIRSITLLSGSLLAIPLTIIGYGIYRGIRSIRNTYFNYALGHIGLELIENEAKLDLKSKSALDAGVRAAASWPAYLFYAWGKPCAYQRPLELRAGIEFTQDKTHQHLVDKVRSFKISG